MLETFYFHFLHIFLVPHCTQKDQSSLKVITKVEVFVYRQPMMTRMTMQGV